jgi:hypothetical protein
VFGLLVAPVVGASSTLLCSVVDLSILIFLL